MNDVIRACVGALAAALFAATLVPQTSADWMDLPLHRPLAPKRQTDPRARFLADGEIVWQLQFTPDGKRVVVRGNQRLHVFDPATGKRERVLGDKDAELAQFALTPDGKQVVVAGRFRVGDTLERRIAVYDLGTGELVRSITPPNGLGGIFCLTPDGKTLVAGGGDRGTPPELLDFQTGKSLAVVRGGVNGERLAASPDGKWLAIGPGVLYRKPVLYDLEDKKVSQELAEMSASPVDQVLFSPDGKELAVVTGGVVLYDVDKKAKARCTLILDKVLEMATVIAYSPDGRLLALAGGRASVVLWDCKQNRLYEDFSGYIGTQCKSVAFSPDGKTLAVAVTTGHVLLFDVPRPKKGDKK